MHSNSALAESHVSDSDSQSLMNGSQPSLIMPSSYSFDQVQTLYTLMLHTVTVRDQRLIVLDCEYDNY